jgi:hypothetical protein
MEAMKIVYLSFCVRLVFFIDGIYEIGPILAKIEVFIRGGCNKIGVIAEIPSCSKIPPAVGDRLM